ncbi:MAG: beta-propeller domain-containing protein [Clostridia bacterium]|nr:beta-propeller domain-containing protein [Clostridia bacterium]
MFKDDYKKEMNELKPSPAALQKVQNRLAESEGPKTHHRINIYRIGYAAVACVLVACMAILPITKAPKTTRTTGKIASVTAELNTAEDYSQVYKLIKDARKNTVLYKGADLLTDDLDIMPEAGTFNEAAGGTASNSVADSSSAGAGNHTETNTQVDGVDEGDIIKTDGKYIYSMIGAEGIIHIFSAENGIVKQIGKIQLAPKTEQFFNAFEMYLTDGRLTVLYSGFDVIDDIEEDFGFTYDRAYPLTGNETHADVFDVSNPTAPAKVAEFTQSGYYNNSRLIGNTLYLITHHNVGNNIDENKPETFVPSIGCNDKSKPVSADKIYVYPDEKQYAFYTVVGSFNTETGNQTDAATVLGSSENIYCSTKNLLLTHLNFALEDAKNEMTTVTRFSLTDGKIDLAATGKIDGELLNQFSMDEYKGNFRFVTTVYPFVQEDEMVSVFSPNDSYAKLTVLDGDLKPLGQIDNLAKGERVYSVRFMGDAAYFVTFRQTDPLFSVDLSDATHPKILGKLKIPGFSDYLFPYGDGLLLGIGMDANEDTGRTECVKISLFDIHDPANVTETAKYRLDGMEYSDALYNHKACIVDPKRQIVAFAGLDNKDNICYRVFDAADGFKQLASIVCDGDYTPRGIIIGNYLYVIDDVSAAAFSLADYTEISRISL